MPNPLQQAGAMSEPSNFAPLHTNRIFTGLWSNRSFLRDAATSIYEERYGMGRQDSILDGYNSEISVRLTLKRRPGCSVYNTANFPRINRFYSFNTFNLANEYIRVMADTATTVYDATKGQQTAIFTKSAGADKTYFLGVGNTLYFCNGVDNKQWNYDPTAGTGIVNNWGIVAPTTAPVATQAPRPNPYPGWQGRMVHTCFVDITPTGAQQKSYFNACVIKDSNGNLEMWGSSVGPVTMTAQLGLGEPAWLPNKGQVTTDGTAQWTNLGTGAWVAAYGYGLGEVICVQPTGQPTLPMQLFVSIHGGMSGGGNPPFWPAVLGQQVADGTQGLVWQNIGPALRWSDIGISQAAPPVNITTLSQIVDPHGYLQTVYQQGRTADTAPTVWGSERASLTQDNNMQWQNSGPFAVPGTAPIQYGYAFVSEDANGNAIDGSNMSPKSTPITVIQGNQVTITGDRSTDPRANMKVYIYRTPVGGSSFLFLDKLNNPPTGQKWTYIDNTPDSGLNPLIQAQKAGEGTPLPAGASCLGYHLGRIFAAVGNVVYVSAGPDAAPAGFSGNAGFNTTFTAQSKITRFWPCSLGMVVFTVRDSYLILGNGTDADPLYMVVFIEEIPLRSYDCFTVNKTTPYILLGNNMLVALDPSAGITEIGFPIADKLEAEYDSSASFITFHSRSSSDTALFVANGNGQWYRMAANNAPEPGSNWSTKAQLAGFNMGCVQSVEVNPGEFRLLIGSTADNQPILMRDGTVAQDNGQSYAVNTIFGSIVLAQPGQLASLTFITLESAKQGSKAGLALLLGEKSGTFEPLNRTRQDPPNLPPSSTIYSDRYHFAQSQGEAWCRHFQMQISWPAENAFNELYTYTIFGQSWNEFRSQ